jgi:hypothetical protein
MVLLIVSQQPTNDFMIPHPWFAPKGNGILVVSKLEGQKRAKEWNAFEDPKPADEDYISAPL